MAVYKAKHEILMMKSMAVDNAKHMAVHKAKVDIKWNNYKADS